ncbi:MAG: DUF971 domain-containing protein [Balneolaceae bacterium]|nr:DUF971 domain-containing protein [Balneolaceae bacterium]
MEQSTTPKSIEVSNKDQVLEITWSDDQTSVYPLFGLRKNCPCVTCRGGHGSMGDFEPESFFEDDPSRIEIRDIEQVGNHAIKITWSDGHNSGMYQWETLRWLDPENHK